MAIESTKELVRNSLRLKDYDYSQPGAYFVTVCTENRICYLGNIVDGIMISFPTSDIVRKIWLEIPEKFQRVDLDAFIIMPNHVHGIIIINKEYNTTNHAPPKTKNWILMQNYKRTVGKIIRHFKGKSTTIIHDSCFPRFQWQRNYYEHVVRSTKELNSIRKYIINNPIKWALDRENRLSKNFNMNLDNYFKDIFEK